MNVFKCLDLEYRKSCLELSRIGVNSRDYYVVKKRHDILSKVLEVLRSMSWVKREEVKQKLTFFMQNNYDYSKLATTFNISKESAYVLISRANKQFLEALGVNNVEELLEDSFNTDNIMINDDITNIFIEEVREHLQARELKEIALEECMQELMSLRKFKKESISNYLKKLDLDKIAYIVYVLQSNSVEYALEKELVRGYIDGVIKDKEELEVKIKELCR